MKKRLIALLLVLFLLAGIFAGCSEETPEPDPAPPQDSQPEQNNPQDSTDEAVEYIYQASISPLTDVLIDPYSVETITSFCVSGKTAFLSAQCVDPEASTEPYYDPVTDEMFEGEAVYQTKFFALNTDTMDVSVLQYEPSTLKEGREGTYLLSSLYPGANDTVWLVETVETYYYDLPADFDPETDVKWDYYMSDEPIVTVLQFNASGALADSTTLTIPDSIGSVFSVMPDMLGNIYLASSDSVSLYDATGTETAALPASGGFLQNFGSQGVGYVAYYGGTQEICIIDPATASFETAITVDNSAWTLGQGSAEFDCTYTQNGVLFGLSSETKSEELILDWLTCDINASDVLQHSVQDDGIIYALTKENGEYSFVRVSLVDSTTIPQKQELVLAAAYLNNEMRSAIIAFNQSQSSSKIVVRDYSLSSMQVDGLRGAEALMQDISGGNVPDLLFTDSLPVTFLAQQGKLLDLKTLIDSDPDLNSDSLMTHLFETAAIDGKLYEVAPRFTISSAAANADVISDSEWTTDAAINALTTLKEGASLIGSSGALQQMISAYLYDHADAFIDWETMSCSFTSDEFIEILRCIEKASYGISEITGKKSSDYKRIYEKSQLLTTHQIDELYDVKYANAVHRDNTAFSGYPTATGALSLFHFVNPIAISTSCSDTNAAWEFVRVFLTDEYQQTSQEIGFPTNRAAFDAYAAKMMTPVYITDADGNQTEVSNGTVKLDDILTMQLYAVTEAEYQLFTELYEQCSSMGRENQTLTNLIRSEIENLLNGAAPEATAAAIQAAVESYLAELK